MTRVGAHLRPARATSWVVRAAVPALLLALTGCAPAAAPEPDTTSSPSVADGAHRAAATGDRGSPSGRGEAGPERPEARAAGLPELGTVPVRRAQDAPADAGPPPVRLDVPALGIDVRVVPSGVDEAGQMALPESARVAAWYRHGPAPGAAAGAAVLAAHVDDLDGVGPFARLAGAEPGTSIRVGSSDGSTHVYVVDTVRAEDKTDLALDAVFDRTGPGRLVLVTCGGRWDAEAGSYTDNVVLTATPRGAG